MKYSDKKKKKKKEPLSPVHTAKEKKITGENKPFVLLYHIYLNILIQAHTNMHNLNDKVFKERQKRTYRLELGAENKFRYPNSTCRISFRPYIRFQEQKHSIFLHSKEKNKMA